MMGTIRCVSDSSGGLCTTSDQPGTQDTPTTQHPPQGCPAAEQGAAWGAGQEGRQGRSELTQLNGNHPSTKTNSLGAPSPRRAQGTWCPHSQIDRP